MPSTCVKIPNEIGFIEKELPDGKILLRGGFGFYEELVFWKNELDIISGKGSVEEQIRKDIIKEQIRKDVNNAIKLKSLELFRQEGSVPSSHEVTGHLLGSILGYKTIARMIISPLIDPSEAICLMHPKMYHELLERIKEMERT